MKKPHLLAATLFGLTMANVPTAHAVSLAQLEQSAQQGNANAEYNLGNAYFNGQGVPQNYAQAVYWWRKAADQGYADAENNLGNTYYFGQGVPQNYAQAVYWYQKAADQGDPNAECNLGNVYVAGQGVPKNTAMALYWWRKAAAQGGKIGEMAQQNIDVYYNQKQYTAQQNAIAARKEKENAGECEIKFTVYNDSAFPITGIYLCDKDFCQNNIIPAATNAAGEILNQSLSPGYHETFKINPYVEWQYGSNFYYVAVRGLDNFGFAQKVYKGTSPWYRTCDRPNIIFKPGN
ncbi:MAG: tetratricopeptide repeat protein [Acidithiobacillus sp.]